MKSLKDLVARLFTPNVDPAVKTITQAETEIRRRVDIVISSALKGEMHYRMPNGNVGWYIVEETIGRHVRSVLRSYQEHLKRDAPNQWPDEMLIDEALARGLITPTKETDDG